MKNVLKYHAKKKGDFFMRELPKRKVRQENIIIKKDYSYSDIVNNNIDSNQINAIIIGIEDLSICMDTLVELLNKCEDIQLNY